MEAEIGGLHVQVKEPQDSPATSGSWQRVYGVASQSAQQVDSVGTLSSDIWPHEV